MIENPMLKVDQLSFSFQHKQLFESLSFELKPGDILHLKGPNGCGKSTLLSILAGLRKPSSGQVRIKSSAANSIEARSFIEYLPPEKSGLFLKMTARQNLSFWSSLKDRQSATGEIDRCLRNWGLGSAFIKYFPTQRFSTGMKRRLALARISLSQSPCFLLDEPLNGLDEEGVHLFKNMLEQHRNNGGSAIVVSHESQILKTLFTDQLTLHL
ncbi:MAG: heme ABC exporter ATP-binding protein CcmA [Deltaproteobacteria bacterium]|nr:heme ABC exporter ATP-binding protein CcmA [Deltaproteobacteria bacterium]